MKTIIAAASTDSKFSIARAELRSHMSDGSIEIYAINGNDNILCHDDGSYVMLIFDNSLNADTNEYDICNICIFASFNNREQAYYAFHNQMMIDDTHLELHEVKHKTSIVAAITHHIVC